MMIPFFKLREKTASKAGRFSEAGIAAVPVKSVFKQRLRGLKEALWRVFYVLYAPIAAIWILVFLVKRWKYIRRHHIVFPFWTWSFGHTAAGVDFFRRIYAPHRVCLIYIPHPRSNRFVLEIFRANLDVMDYQPLLPKGIYRLGRIDVNWFCLYLSIVNLFDRSLTLVKNVDDLYKLGRKAEELCEGNFGATGLRRGANMTAYMRLLEENRGGCPVFPAEEAVFIIQKIKEGYPRFRPERFVALHLRNKKSSHLSDAIRDVRDQSRYRPAVAFLSSRGYSIVASGETQSEIFKDIPHFVDLRQVAVPYEKSNIFSLSQAAFFIGNQSGPHVVPNTFCRPCLLTDALAYNLGTFAQQDLILFKHLVDQNGRRLSLEEIYASDIAYCHALDREGIAIRECPAPEILSAVQEMLALIEGKIFLSQEDHALIQWFRSLLNPKMSIFHTGNRPPLSFLRAARRLSPDAAGPAVRIKESVYDNKIVSQ